MSRNVLLKRIVSICVLTALVLTSGGFAAYMDADFAAAAAGNNVRTLSGMTTIGGRNVGVNLRKLLNEEYDGFSVVQGGCTDGVYVYQLMVSSTTQQGRILKMRLDNNEVVGRSGVLNISHGNGMAYDSRRHTLVIVGREDRKQELTIVDANGLTIIRQENVKYSNFAKAKDGQLSPVHQRRGIASITYNRTYDVYLAQQRDFRNIIVFNPDTFEAIGIIFTQMPAGFTGTFQAIDADDKYVYMLLSADGAGQPNNVILPFDWNSEYLDPVRSGKEKFIANGWYCNNGKNGLPDAIIKIATPYEAENIYHTTDSAGNAHFYMSEYFNNPQYKTVKKKMKVQVLKKVRKKVKWKRVKRKGKWKWKYKRKKVWVYKTKTKKVKVRVLTHYDRDNYIYDLGVF